MNDLHWHLEQQMTSPTHTQYCAGFSVACHMSTGDPASRIPSSNSSTLTIGLYFSIKLNDWKSTHEWVQLKRLNVGDGSFDFALVTHCLQALHHSRYKHSLFSVNWATKNLKNQLDLKQNIDYLPGSWMKSF